MNIERAIKGYLVPEFKNFNETEYLRLVNKDELNNIKSNQEQQMFVELMGQDIKIQIAYRKAMLPFVKKAQLFLVISIVAMISYVAVLGVPLAKKEYADYKIGIAYQEKMKNEKTEVKVINDETRGVWCDKNAGYIYYNGNVVWRNGCK